MKINIKNPFKKISSFLKEVRLEMKRIDWLSIKQTLRYTLIVILISVIVGAFLGGVDFVLKVLLNKFVFK